MLRRWQRLLRAAVDLSSLEVFKAGLDGGLRNLAELKVSLPVAQGLHSMIFKALSNTNHSIILSYASIILWLILTLLYDYLLLYLVSELEILSFVCFVRSFLAQQDQGKCILAKRELNRKSLWGKLMKKHRTSARCSNKTWWCLSSLRKLLKNS